MRDDDDSGGAPVVEAAHLCATSGSGQVSSTARAGRTAGRHECPHTSVTVKASEVPRAVAAGMAAASALGLRVDDAIVLHNSNRLAVRLLPCDVLARVAPVAHQSSAEIELEVARLLAERGSPVAAPEPRVEPRVHLRDGFAVTLWVYYRAAAGPDLAPPAYARALSRLHAGLRQIDLPSPRFTDRVAEAQWLVGNPSHTPELVDADRQLLSETLGTLSRAVVDRGPTEQLLHGEPHPGNVLRTEQGLLFMDFETCCTGPVEFDVAHAPAAVDRYYPAADQDLIRACRILVLAMVATWRWDRDDQLPHGRQLGLEWLSQIRAALAQGV